MDSPEPASRPTGRRLALGIVLLAVLGFQLYHLYGLHVSKDLPLWDESAYIGWGDEFLQDHLVGSITNAPFYHLLYAGVIKATSLLESFWVMQYGLKLVLTLLVVLLAWRWSRSAALSLMLGVFFAYSYYHLNAEVLVYYSALIPYLAAILVARRAPGLSLGLSFLAGLGRLEYMAIPIIHFGYLVWQARRNGAARRGLSWGVLLAALPAATVWVFNLYALTRITVWQFHNRLWFAWSQNYAFFRYLTGRDPGGNPWLDHQFIAERDFPGAHSLAEAVAVNPGAVAAHTWFNLYKLPDYLADFVTANQNAGGWASIPVVTLWVIGAAAVVALAVRRPRWRALVDGFRTRQLDIGLCAAGLVAAAPGVIVSSKTNYIMSMVPAALWAICCLHAAARKEGHYARFTPAFMVAVALGFGLFTFTRPLAYSARGERGPIYQDALAMRTILGPLRQVRILGVSTASYINYLGRANGHVFIEPLAISPVNRQATDFSLASLIRANDPDVLLINSHWRSSRSYAEAVDGFDFAGWDPHPLNDGVLYTRAGLFLRPAWGEGWFGEERGAGRTWRWSGGEATVRLDNVRESRPAVLRFQLRSVDEREISLTLADRVLHRVRLGADVRQAVEVAVDPLPAGPSVIRFQSDRPAVRPGAGDPRELAFCVENLEFAWLPRSPGR